MGNLKLLPRAILGIAAGLCLAGLSTLAALAQDDVPPGITEPMVLAPFVPSTTLCQTPPGQQALAFVQDNHREFMEGIGLGVARAAADRDLQYTNLVAEDDGQRMIEQVEGVHANKVGAVIVAPVDPRSLSPHLQALIAEGVYVGAIVPPPAVTILNAPQYQAGEILARAAADYIETKLGGTARVVLLTHDSLQFLAPRFRAMRDVLGELPGVTIVADISPTPVNEEGGYATMKSILIAQPDVDVVLGADTVVMGALRALEEAGKTRADQFLGGIDGEPDAVAAMQSPNSPYKATVSLASSIFGYALGQYAADWMEGKSVPQAMDVLPTLLTRDNVGQYQSDLADPGVIWKDQTRRDAYLRMYGSICYDTRDQYLNFAWSSETQ